MYPSETSGIMTISTVLDLKDWTVPAHSLMRICARKLLIQARYNFQKPWRYMLHNMQGTVHPNTNMLPLTQEWRKNAEFFKALEKPYLLLPFSSTPPLLNSKSPPSPKITGLVSFMPVTPHFLSSFLFFFFHKNINIYYIICFTICPL